MGALFVKNAAQNGATSRRGQFARRKGDSCRLYFASGQGLSDRLGKFETPYAPSPHSRGLARSQAVDVSAVSCQGDFAL